MYDRETVKNTKKLFYTSFGKYISRERSSSGLKVKWINYETGIKSIFVRLDANQKNAKVCIDIQHKDSDIRELHYEQFIQLKKVFSSLSDVNWTWDENYTHDNSTTFSRISSTLPNFNIYDKSQWKTAFEFYKKSLNHFDVFWCEFKELFLQLQ
tara:strand:- start:337 stop:798 length:462 start_codon:yes stop_codon:yes gene_type:complete